MSWKTCASLPRATLSFFSSGCSDSVLRHADGPSAGPNLVATRSEKLHQFLQSAAAFGSTGPEGAEGDL